MLMFYHRNTTKLYILETTQTQQKYVGKLKVDNNTLFEACFVALEVYSYSSEEKGVPSWDN